MPEPESPKSHEFAKKTSDDYVEHYSKSGNKGYVKRDNGPARHHVPYGRHKRDEKLVDEDLVQDVIEDIAEEDGEDITPP